MASVWTATLFRSIPSYVGLGVTPDVSAWPSMAYPLACGGTVLTSDLRDKLVGVSPVWGSRGRLSILR